MSPVLEVPSVLDNLWWSQSSFVTTQHRNLTHCAVGHWLRVWFLFNLLSLNWRSEQGRVVLRGQGRWAEEGLSLARSEDLHGGWGWILDSLPRLFKHRNLKSLQVFNWLRVQFEVYIRPWCYTQWSNVPISNRWKKIYIYWVNIMRMSACFFLYLFHTLRQLDWMRSQLTPRRLEPTNTC